MKENGLKTAIQNQPVIREYRREIKIKLDEIEDIIHSNLKEIRNARIDKLTNELEVNKAAVASLRTQLTHAGAVLNAYSTKIQKLEDENLALKKELSLFKVKAMPK